MFQPTDLVQQSLPFSYYYLTITSNSTHAVKVFSVTTGGEQTFLPDSTSQNLNQKHVM